MSQENVQSHHRIYAALNEGDVEALLTLCDGSVEIRSTFAAVGGATYHGHTGVEKWVRDLQEAWGGGFRVQAETYFDLGAETLVFGFLRGRGAQSGAEVAMPAYGVAKWRDGRCVYHRAYAEKDEALAQLGVREEGLKPISEPDLRVSEQDAHADS
jgi:ketosteroid isomerase-like protein